MSAEGERSCSERELGAASGRALCIHACVLSHSGHVRLCDLMDCSLLGSSVHGLLRQEYWNGLSCSLPGDLPNPGIKPASLMSPALAGRLFTSSATWEAQGLVSHVKNFGSCSTGRL